MATDLDYDDGMSQLPKGVFRISPSSFNSFMVTPHIWYRTQVLKDEEFIFKGSTASVLGTVVHYCAECAAKYKKPDIEEIERYTDTFKYNKDVDLIEVGKQYKDMANTLITEYVGRQVFKEVETYLKYDLGDGVWVAGSVDAITNGSIIDYKTYNSKAKPRAIPSHYLYQLLIYAFLAKKSGIDITHVTLVYINRNIVGGISEKTGKPLKSYPPEVTKISRAVTEEDMEWIENLLMLCKRTYVTAQNHLKLVPLLYRDLRLETKLKELDM